MDAVSAPRMPMALTDPTLPGNPIVFANQSFLNLSGYSMDEVLGQQPHFMNGHDTNLEDAAKFVRILARDEDGVVETVQYAKNGRRFVARHGDGHPQLAGHHLLKPRACRRPALARLQDDRAATDDEQAPQRSFAHLRDRSKLLLASARELTWRHA